jgi:thioredoxin reductase (NADPH)
MPGPFALPKMNDVIIIGSGPAGIATAGALTEAGLNVVIYDKGSLAHGVTRYPIYMKFFSTSTNVELLGYPLITVDEKPTRDEYLNYLRRYVRDKKLSIISEHCVEAIEKTGDGFRVAGHDKFGRAFEAAARFVVVAIGAYDIPRSLGVPGEDLPKVSHYFTEVHPYATKKVAVVGGRNSAAETALLLWRAGSEVTLIHRGDKMRPLKYWLAPDLENRIKNGEIKAFFGAHITEITPSDIAIETSDKTIVRVENDFVLAMTGYEPDADFLTKAGVAVDKRSGRPKHDPHTLETNVPGLYVAGVIVSGNISNEIFIENSRHHGDLILNSIRARLGQKK